VPLNFSLNEFSAQEIRHQPLAEASGMENLGSVLVQTKRRQKLPVQWIGNYKVKW
jgi:hypothetical protein